MATKYPIGQVPLAATSGDPGLDKTVSDQAFEIAKKFHIAPKLVGMRFAPGEGADNAWVTREVVVKGTTATVVLGPKLLRQWVFSSVDYGWDSVEMVLAHEMGHVYQLNHRVAESLGDLDDVARKTLELQADFIAGWYLRAVRHITLQGIDAAGSKLVAVANFEGAHVLYPYGIQRSTALLGGWTLANAHGDFEIDDVAKAGLVSAQEMSKNQVN